MAFGMAWLPAVGRGQEFRIGRWPGRAGCSRRSAASCTGVSPRTGMRCSSWPTRCCACRAGADVAGVVAGAGTPARPRRAVRRVNGGRIEVARVRGRWRACRCRAWDDGRIGLGVDISPWLRPGAETSPDRLFCHVHARGKGNAQMIPGWPYSVVAALEPGGPVDAAAGCGPARPGRRRDRGDRRPGPRGGGTDHRRRALARRRPGHPGGVRRRL